MSYLTHTTPAPGEWAEGGRCRETDAEVFFPEKGESNLRAKRICARCEVMPQCLEYAVEHRIRWGIWGGTSDMERRRLWREAA